MAARWRMSAIFVAVMYFVCPSVLRKTLVGSSYFSKTFGSKKYESHCANSTHCHELFMLGKSYFLPVGSVLLDDDIDHCETDVFNFLHAADFKEKFKYHRNDMDIFEEGRELGKYCNYQT